MFIKNTMAFSCANDRRQCHALHFKAISPPEDLDRVLAYRLLSFHFEIVHAMSACQGHLVGSWPVSAA